MLTKLLEKKKPATPSIEVADAQVGLWMSCGSIYNTFIEPNDEEEDIDWEFDQTLPVEPTEGHLLGKKPRYGFNNQYTSYFEPLQDEISEIIELSDPDRVTVAVEDQTRYLEILLEILYPHCSKLLQLLSEHARRRKSRLEAEDQKFDPEYYMYV
jgi:hypothetical protein